MLGDLYQLDFTSENLPKDVAVTTGILDVDEQNGDDMEATANKFLEWVFTDGRFPVCDYEFYAPDIGEIEVIGKEFKALKEKESAAVCAHDCGDPHCPHGRSELAFERVALHRKLSNAWKLNFAKWEPFKYPIISINNVGLMKISSLLPINYDLNPRVFRVYYQKSLRAEDGSKKVYYNIPRDFDLIEAIYFPGETSDFKLMSNGKGTKIRPVQKYNFTYMVHQGRMTELSLKFTGEEVNFAIIAWVFMDGNIIRTINDNHILSTLDGKLKAECVSYITRLL